MWFVAITAIYWLLQDMGYGYNFCLDSCQPSLYPNGLWITNLIGLFVPIGPNNAVLILIYLLAIPKLLLQYPIRVLLGIPYIFLFTFLLFRGEKLLQSLHFSPIIKIVVNLGILILLATCLDLLLFGSWAGMELFLRSL